MRRFTLRAAIALALLLLTVSPALAQAPPDGIPADAEPATVERVVDGDTVRVELADGTRETVRLIGIDTPETRDPGEPVGCYGPEASERAEKLLTPGRAVWLEADLTDRDRYDRLLRYVWTEQKNGSGVYLVNELMVRDGYALAIRYEPDTARADQLERAQERAIDRGEGLWTACPELVASLAPPEPEPEPQPAEAPPVEVAPAVEAAPLPVAADTGGSDPSYPDLCIPIGAPDIDCPQAPGGNFTVYQPDPHGFDRDVDGIGCEG